MKNLIKPVCLQERLSKNLAEMERALNQSKYQTNYFSSLFSNECGMHLSHLCFRLPYKEMATLTCILSCV